MAKQTGIPAKLFVGSYDISGDTGSIDSIAESRQMLDVTGIDKEFFERLPGLGDGEINFTAFHDVTSAHAVLSPIGTAAKIATASMGTAVGSSAASLSGAQASYSTNREQGGGLTHQAQLQSFAGYGVEWGRLLTGPKDTASGTATATVDWSAASTSGASAYLHVLSVTGGTVTVICQDSPDNSSFSNISGMSFTATSAGTAERVASSGTAIARYTRYNVTGGTAVIAVNFVRK